MAAAAAALNHYISHLTTLHSGYGDITPVTFLETGIVIIFQVVGGELWSVVCILARWLRQLGSEGVAEPRCNAATRLAPCLAPLAFGSAALSCY